MPTFHLLRRSYLVFSLFLPFLADAQKSVLTQHNDINRSGWYDNETILNKNNVKPGSFGKIFVRQVDDEIYAQPLVKLKLSIPGKGTKNVVFVATVNNTIYAFDADSANAITPYWKVNLTPAHSRVIKNSDETGACSNNYRDFDGNMGIVGTPVIDSTTNTMYLVARSVDTTGGATNFKQYLHALDITTGAEKANSPALITATVAGTGDGSSGGSLPFNSQKQNQRGGLLLLNGNIFITWGSHCDWSPYHGWLMAYDKTTLQQKSVYCSTYDGFGGGIWMSGGGPSGDANGSVYLAVGNGSTGKNGDATNARNRSSTALKLAPSGSSFTIQSYFTPKNYQTLDGADLDFGVTQLMIIPNSDRAITGAKDGQLFLMNKDNMGGYDSATDHILQTIDLGSNAHLHASMSYFKGSKEFVYAWSENSLLRAYPYNRNTGVFDLNNTIQSGLQGPTGNSGAMLSVSSNGSVDSTGILWASYASNGDANQSVRPGILRAIDASDVTKELWNSSADPNDNPGNYAKFNCPTVANGKVYLASFSNQLLVYGLTGGSPNTCSSTNVALNKQAFASSMDSANHAPARATDGNMSTGWVSQASDPQYIYIDLGQSYDICRVVLHWEAALGKNFKIQVSNDASSWTDVATFTNNIAFNNFIPLQASGRYVRMFGTQRGTTGGYALYEFQVNGKPTSSNCPAPASLSATGVDQTAATLNWASNGAEQYVVQYKTVTAVDWNQLVATDNILTVTGLACNTPYQFRVRSVCTVGDSSAFSSSAGFTTTACTVNCDPLPTRWSTQDIGAVGITGSACYQGSTSTFALSGSGADIWGTSDQFRFAYKTVVAGGAIIARVVDQDKTNGWNKVGIMVRESLAEGSRHAFIAITSANGVAFQNRTVTDGTSNNVNTGPGIVAPYWLKMVIAGTTYTGYMSPDGLTWTKVGNTVDAGFGNGSPVYAGLAISSHTNTALSTAHVDNFSLGFVLPLNLVSFTGRLSLNQSVVLQWITTKETGTNYFIVERTTDNSNYIAIDTVYADNNGEFTQDYEATDYHALPGTNYYRLRIVDFDGNVTYSPIVAVKVGTSKAPVLYPNPANGKVTILAGTDPILHITMFNILGETVRKIPNISSLSTIEIPTYPFDNGLYFVEIRTSNLVYTQKLLIHH